MNWRVAVLIAVAVLGVVGLALVFLVLTGIIAEPETVIENLVRMLPGE